MHIIAELLLLLAPGKLYKKMHNDVLLSKRIVRTPLNNMRFSESNDAYLLPHYAQLNLIIVYRRYNTKQEIL